MSYIVVLCSRFGAMSVAMSHMYVQRLEATTLLMCPKL